MKRREFVVAGLAGSLAHTPWSQNAKSSSPAKGDDIRAAFPRLEKEIYLNAAGMMPLSSFGQEGLQRYMAFQRDGGAGGMDDYVKRMWSQIRNLFAQLIGAKQREVGLVHCTKAGEQIALDAVDAIREGGNIVTNDLHFSGSLHNLVGLQKAGREVRIVRAENWKTPVEAMKSAIDDRTALVNISLVSNINGHVEDIRSISKTAHRHGALVYADIIQAAGILPIDVHEMGIDLAACSCYKWLYGTYGSGFLFVREGLQGTRLPDRLFPGSARHNYAPWRDEVNPDFGDFEIHLREDATRYQPGHVNYLGYCAVYEGLKFLLQFGVEEALKHSIKLNLRLKEKLDPKQYACISPHADRSPIISFIATQPESAWEKLAASRIVVSRSGNRIRVSPALFNNESDIDLLSLALNG